MPSIKEQTVAACDVMTFLLRVAGGQEMVHPEEGPMNTFARDMCRGLLELGYEKTGHKPPFETILQEARRLRESAA